MADSAEKNYQNATRFFRSFEDMLKKFLQMLADYLEENSRTSAQREIARYIREGGNLYSYSIQGDKIGGTIEALKLSLDEQGVPYVALANQPERILIRPDDIEKVKDINRDVLIAKGNYYQEVDATKMENVIATADFVKNKEILTLHGLNKYESEVLKNKCNAISKGFMVGTEKTADGNTNISVQAKSVYSGDPKKKDFCKAMLEAQLSLYGPNHKIKKQQIDMDEEVDKKVAELKGTPVVHYVVGAYSKRRYIELNEDRFELHHRIPGENGKMTDVIETSCQKDDPDYEMELQRAMDRIYDKVIINDPELLNAHLVSKEQLIQTDRPEKSNKQDAYSKAERQAANQIDRMIKERLASDPAIKSMPTEDIMRRYSQEAANIIQAAIEEKFADGYKMEDIAELRGILNNENVKIFDYHNIPSQLTAKQCESHLARPAVTKESPEKNQEQKQRNNEERE